MAVVAQDADLTTVVEIPPRSDRFDPSAGSADCEIPHEEIPHEGIPHDVRDVTGAV